MDSTPHSGGLEVVLGLEADSGLRWSEVSAPMGRLPADAFAKELLHWEGVDVLCANPWSGGDEPQAWEISAAYEALWSAEEWLIVDGGTGMSQPDLPFFVSEHEGTVRIVLVELSVLGLARAKAQSSTGSQRCLYLGVPAGLACSKNKASVSLAQAASYLGVDFVGTLQPLQSLEKDIVHGMGIAEVPRRYRELLENLIEEVQAVAKPRSRGEGNAGESSPFGAVPRRA
jgi:hypothetical protein